ncbi:antitoxin of toxin-antitoxin stability system [Saccharophagus sp. K07]|jgi:predicted transcriptional regulator|uniref:antitoxin of toxin-antitoxin stability system n=1 Tax=Saccharophagus sp. K07 TaxID=2283636 RepID=UPI00165272E1|nr:antitoxin of toxin-antitoxin stability system [Saccharophagus sp. K07]MBC6906710.1 antitoxin of toxin-antitoxin stability system [Saccharophagus sp. K07]
MKEAVFTMKLEPELRNAFMAAAEAAHRPASQVMRELMREFVQRQRAAQEYQAFLEQKVSIARQQIAEGLVFSNEEVEKEFASMRGDKDAE